VQQILSEGYQGKKEREDGHHLYTGEESREGFVVSSKRGRKKKVARTT